MAPLPEAVESAVVVKLTYLIFVWWSRTGTAEPKMVNKS